ncbi:MAG: hypothetical protein PHP45_03405 [Elusimicrobiales bacterium]|nr:hypothetical protein [Elusimicrobiales bacterium]
MDAIKRAIHDTITRYGVKRLALLLNMSATNIYRWGESEQVSIPLVHFVRVNEITGDYASAMALCEVLGGTFLPVPRRDKGDKLDIKLLKEFAEFLHVRATALADGKVTTAELVRIKKEGSETITVIAQAMADAERIHNEGK